MADEILPNFDCLIVFRFSRLVEVPEAYDFQKVKNNQTIKFLMNYSFSFIDLIERHFERAKCPLLKSWCYISDQFRFRVSG